MYLTSLNIYGYELGETNKHHTFFWNAPGGELFTGRADPWLGRLTIHR